MTTFESKVDGQIELSPTAEEKQTKAWKLMESFSQQISRVREHLAHTFPQTQSTGDEEDESDDHYNFDTFNSTFTCSPQMEYETRIVKSKEQLKSLSGKKPLQASKDDFRYDAFHIVLGKPEVGPEDDLFKRMKFMVVVGRLLGVLPISGVFGNSYKELYMDRKSGAFIVSILILACLVFNLCMEVTYSMKLSKKNAYEIAQAVRGTIQFCWSCLIYINFLLRGKKFINLFHQWSKTSIFYTLEDRHLRRDVILVTVLVLASAILENAILHLEYLEVFDSISGEVFHNTTIGRNFIETYHRRSNAHWLNSVPFHETIAVIAFVQHKCMLYGCNYMDIMITLFSRAIYFKFKMLYKLAREHLAKPARKGLNSTKSSKMINRHGWAQLAQDHKKLCDLLQEFETFFSPLIFGSYAVNIYYICIQLLDGITTNVSSHSVIHSIYAPWSFLHIILRVYLVSIAAARINSYAHLIRRVLQECPVECYNPEIARVDRKVTTGPEIGLSGFGAFTITKPFILKIISVVFTFEIVLLQGKPSGC